MPASLTLSLAAAAAAVAAVATPLPASAAPSSSSGMDQVGRGTEVDVCGRSACLNRGASGTATGTPFAAATFDLLVTNLSTGRPGAGGCVKVGLGLHLLQLTPTSADSFHGDGQGKLCVAADGVATVTGRYSGGGYVGEDWSWGSGQGSLTATFGVDGTVTWRATGTYSTSPLK